MLEIPTICPTCSYPLERSNDLLFCKNSACSAQLSGKLQHFVKTLGIKGLGPKALEKLDLSDLIELFYLEEADIAERLGSDKLAEKIFKEIQGAKYISLATFIASQSIPLIGNTAGTKIASVISNLDQLTVDKCKEAGLGEKATHNLMSWYSTEYQEIKEFLPFNFQVAETSSNKKTICITGKLKSFKTKALAAEALKEYSIVENITRTTDYLVDEDNKNSSKRQKAEEYGITIISNLNDFLNRKNIE